MISFDDFKKLDLKIARIKEVKEHPDADRLFVLSLEVGDEQRQVVAGIKNFYKPEDLIDKKVVLIANMEPAKIRGVESQGMVLAAKDAEALTLLTPDKDIKVGSKIS